MARYVIIKSVNKIKKEAVRNDRVRKEGVRNKGVRKEG